MEDVFANSKSFIATNEITGVWSFLKSIDWSEHWLQAILVVHACLLMLCYASRHIFTVQAVLFIILLAVVYSAEMLNKLGAQHWKLFSQQQYFDSSGMFISLVISMPLLVICVIIMIQWIWQSSTLLISIKQKELIVKQKLHASNKEKKEL